MSRITLKHSEDYYPMGVPFGYRSKLISKMWGRVQVLTCPGSKELDLKQGSGSEARMTLTPKDLPPDSSDLNHSNGYSTEEHRTTQLKRKLGI